ncbi:MAG: transposase [Betaproteobacteria bacterium]
MKAGTDRVVHGKQYAELAEDVVQVDEDSTGICGARGIHAELTAGLGFRRSRKRVARLMHKRGLMGVQ